MISTQVVVVGGGPGGYAAAFLAADLGLKTALVDPEVNPGWRVRLSRLHPVEGAAARRQPDSAKPAMRMPGASRSGKPTV